MRVRVTATQSGGYGHPQFTLAGGESRVVDLSDAEVVRLESEMGHLVRVERLEVTGKRRRGSAGEVEG